MPHSLIKKVRHTLGMNQQQFAFIINTPVATLRDWEQGRYSPPGAVIELVNYFQHKEETMKVKVIHTEKQGFKVARVISGEMIGMMDLDWHQPLSDLKRDAELAINELLYHPKFSKIAKKYAGRMFIYEGGNHLQYVVNKKPDELNWFMVADHFISSEES